MKKLSQTLLIILILTAGVANAQTGTDSYEYATVFSSYTGTGKPTLYISFSSGDFKEVEIDKNDAKPQLLTNQTSALKYIAQMSKEGWEVVNSQPTPLSWGYLLKRKHK